MLATLGRKPCCAADLRWRASSAGFRRPDRPSADAEPSPCYAGSMLKRIALIAAVAIAVLGLVIASQPGHLHVERSIAISAPPALVFPLINDFHAWPNWSPWEKLDPDMKRELSGAPEGKGSKVELFYDPNGNGTGMTLIRVAYVNGDSFSLDLNRELGPGNGTRAVRLRLTNLGGIGTCN